jgi:hypothetical protein
MEEEEEALEGYLMWTPRPRCCPEHSRQKKIPKVTEAHWGLGFPQSKHL